MGTTQAADPIGLMVEAGDALPGAYFAQIALRYHAGKMGDRWECEIAADLKGDDGDMFSIWGPTPAEVVHAAVAEAWRRIENPN